MSIYLRQTYTPTLQTPAISQPLRGSCMAGYNLSCLTAFCHATHLLSVELQSYNEFGKQPNHCVDFWLIMGKCLDWQIAVAFGKQSSSTRKKTISKKTILRCDIPHIFVYMSRIEKCADLNVECSEMNSSVSDNGQMDQTSSFRMKQLCFWHILCNHIVAAVGTRRVASESLRMRHVPTVNQYI